MRTQMLTTFSESELRSLIASTVQAALSERVEPEELRAKKDWLTNEEAQAYLDVSRSTLQRYRTSGLLPYSKLGANVYYKRADINALLENSRVA